MTDISREAVERRVSFIEAAISTEGKPNRPKWPTHTAIHMREAADMLRALRDALDAAEKERDELHALCTSLEARGDHAMERLNAAEAALAAEREKNANRPEISWATLDNLEFGWFDPDDPAIAKLARWYKQTHPLPEPPKE